MLYEVEGNTVYCDDGGVAHVAGQPALLLVHGALNDHSVWAEVSRRFAEQGYNVLAPDLPGHGRSGGTAKADIAELSAWVIALMDAAGIANAMLAGHSMGALVALETAAAVPGRVRRLAMLGVAFPMRVSDALLAAARDDVVAAIEMVTGWSHAPVDGSVIDKTRQMMLGLAAASTEPLLYIDLHACNSYTGGETAAHGVRCPALFIAGTQDRMTPAKASRLLTAALPDARVVQLDAGHAMLAEQPDGVFDALLAFATEP